MQIYNKLFIKQLFFNTENGDEVRRLSEAKELLFPQAIVYYCEKCVYFVLY